jgi:hypothetical protein
MTWVAFLVCFHSFSGLLHCSWLYTVHCNPEFIISVLARLFTEDRKLKARERERERERGRERGRERERERDDCTVRLGRLSPFLFIPSQWDVATHIQGWSSSLS